MDYHAIPARIIVKPLRDAMFEPLATVIELDDEAAGPFVRVSQPGAPHKVNCITLDGPEWPLIRDAIQQMMNVAQGMDADTLPPNT
jgi:hypothetical protein